MRKFKSYFKKPVDSWRIEETETIMCLIDLSGQLMSLTAGSHVVMNHTQQYGILLGFSDKLGNIEQFKNINVNLA